PSSVPPTPPPEQVARYSDNTKVPDDDTKRARKNTDIARRRVLMKTVPADGREATAIQFNNIAKKAVYSGQVPPMNIFNPAAWSEFIQAWKRGDFKNKR